MDANDDQNTVVSPFLVKLLLSILAEAAGQDTSTHKELLSVLPSIRTVEETRELYGRTFGSLLVSLNYISGSIIVCIMQFLKKGLFLKNRKIAQITN